VNRRFPANRVTRAKLGVAGHPLKDERRRAWISAIGGAQALTCRLLGRATARDGGVSDIDLKRNLQHELLRLRADEFPNPEASARAMAASFLGAAQAVLGAATAERVELCAPTLEAATAALDALMEDLRTREAAGWQSRFRD
jgi:hypothetical protein